MKGTSHYILWLGLSLIVLAFSISLWYKWMSSTKDTQLFIIQKSDLNSLESTISNVCDNSVATKICTEFHYTRLLEDLTISGDEICYKLKGRKMVCKKILCNIKESLDIKNTDSLIKPEVSSRGYAILNICAEKVSEKDINVSYILL